MRPRLLALCALCALIPRLPAAPLATDYPSIQEAIDKNPGQVVEIPAGDYTLTSALKLTTDHSGLSGSGHLIQTNPEEPVIDIRGRTDIRIRGLRLSRPVLEGDKANHASAIDADHCDQLTVENVIVTDNASGHAAIHTTFCSLLRILNCTVENYMAISIDDRTASKDWGFAFRCIDGTGIVASYCKGGLIQGNSVIEHRFIPTQENQQKYGLGQFTKRNPVKGILMKQDTWDKGYAGAWHQGAAIGISGPEDGDYIQILNNYIENAAQGLDCHSDHVIIANNIVNNAFVGMKAMHGARNVLILANQFSKNDLWSIGLMAGAASHPAGVSAHEGVKPEESKANVDGGTIVAKNVISDFGYGSASWMWKDSGRFVIKFDNGQKDFNPPLHDVLVQANIVYDTGRDGLLENGRAVIAPPRYNYAIVIPNGKDEPINLHVPGNIFHPGDTKAVSNKEFQP